MRPLVKRTALVPPFERPVQLDHAALRGTDVHPQRRGQCQSSGRARHSSFSKDGTGDKDAGLGDDLPNSDAMKLLLRFGFLVCFGVSCGFGSSGAVSTGGRDGGSSTVLAGEGRSPMECSLSAPKDWACDKLACPSFDTEQYSKAAFEPSSAASCRV
jgi:hypothetical protein